MWGGRQTGVSAGHVDGLGENTLLPMENSRVPAVEPVALDPTSQGVSSAQASPLLMTPAIGSPGSQPKSHTPRNWIPSLLKS